MLFQSNLFATVVINSFQFLTTFWLHNKSRLLWQERILKVKWFGISLVFIINRTLHGCLKIQNFSSRVENIYSTWPCKTLFIYWYLFLTIFTFYFFLTENILYTLWLCTFILITGTVLLKTHLLQKCVYLTDVQQLYKK